MSAGADGTDAGTGSEPLKDALGAVTALVRDPRSMASVFSATIAEAGDLLWDGPTAHAGGISRTDVGGSVQAGLYLLADSPGGVTFAGQHWCTCPHPACPGPGTHDGSASERKGPGAVHTPLWLAAAVTAPALDALVYRPGPLTACAPGNWKRAGSADILGLRVADISCGSGAFLLAAGCYLASALTMAWAEEGDPRADNIQAAVREVASSCLYGADINGASAALARLSLQLAAYEPGQPCPAQAGRFTVGDSLLGTDFSRVFPEVAVKGGFDAVIGNPPFLGGQKITREFGTAYRDRLVSEVARGQRGSADLSAYFLLRSWDLLNDGGQLALIATNTLAQGARAVWAWSRCARRAGRS